MGVGGWHTTIHQDGKEKVLILEVATRTDKSFGHRLKFRGEFDEKWTLA